MIAVAYVGFSISADDGRRIVDADFRPPVRRGDLPKLSDDVTHVAIIDGVILSDAAVGHREIIALLERGVKVIGGGSMGALRAAELSGFGMIGVGSVYEEYASGRAEGDDEVLLAFDPATLAPLSEPLINLRLNLSRAVELGVISRGGADAVLDRLRKLFYVERTVPAMMSIAERALASDEAAAFRSFVSDGLTDYKRNDAIAVLTLLNEFSSK